MIVSNCCCAADRCVGETDFSEFGICPECGEHCEFVDEYELLEDDASLDLPKESEQ